MNIDYTKLNNRIVEQAVTAARTKFSLTDEQRNKLFQNKIERARAMIAARDNVYITIED